MRGAMCFLCRERPALDSGAYCRECELMYRRWDELAEQARAESWPRQAIDFTQAPLLRFLIDTERHGAWHHATDPERSYF